MTIQPSKRPVALGGHGDSREVNAVELTIGVQGQEVVIRIKPGSGQEVAFGPVQQEDAPSQGSGSAEVPLEQADYRKSKRLF